MDEKDIPYQLDQYLKGRLTEEEKDNLWEEFLKHPEYLQWLEIEVTAKDYLQNIDPDRTDGDNVTHLSEPTEPARKFNYIAYAAAILLLALTGVIGFLLMSDDPSAELAIRDISPAEMYSTVILRGAESETTTEEDIRLNSGVEAAISGRPDESIDHFNAVLEGSPTTEQVAMTRFNIALLNYNQGDFRQAEANFLAASTGSPSDLLTEEALWYRANALLRAGEEPVAISQLEELIQMEGFYQQDAEMLLDRLRERSGDQ